MHPECGSQKMRYQKLEDLPWGARDLSHMLGIPHLGPDTREMGSLGLKTSQAYWRVVRNQDSVLEECTRRLTFSLTQSRGSILKTAWDSGQLARTTPVVPPPPPSLGSGLSPSCSVLIPTTMESAIANENVHTWKEWCQLGHQPYL